MRQKNSWQLCRKARVLWMPGLVLLEHRVQDREQFPHAGGRRDVEGLSGTAEPCVEDPEHRVVLEADEGGHVEHRAAR